jgi:hypothetical protein
MGEFRRLIKDTSHSVRGIRNGCILIIGVGILLSALLHPLLPEPPPPDPVEAIYQLYRSGAWNTDLPPAPSEATQGLDPHVFWLHVLRGRSSADIPSSPVPGEAFAHGLGQLSRGNIDQALQRMQQENERFPHPLVRKVVLQTALQHDRLSLLNTLQHDPGYAEEVRGAFAVQMGLEQNDWRKILRHFWEAEYRHLSASAMLLSLIGGAIWTGMITGLYPGIFRIRYTIPILLALCLGWISTWPTLWSGMWLDRSFGLSEGSSFFSALSYFLVSVALREELCKLLLYAPLLIWTIRNGRETEALLLGALVGLGFAVEENIGYLQAGPGGAMVSRFVSANILHFTLTGATALAFTRLLRSPAKWMHDSLQVIGLAIGLHALYNTLLSQPVPGLGDLSYFSGTALAGCGWLFFREVSTLCPPRARILSQTALFCWGFCLILNLEMVQASAVLPWSEALNITGQAALAGVFSGYLFLYWIQEPLARD